MRGPGSDVGTLFSHSCPFFSGGGKNFFQLTKAIHWLFFFSPLRDRFSFLSLRRLFLPIPWRKCILPLPAFFLGGTSHPENPPFGSDFSGLEVFFFLVRFRLPCHFFFFSWIFAAGGHHFPGIFFLCILQYTPPPLMGTQ